MARAKVSERSFVDAAGTEVERMEQATGATYTILGAGKTFSQQFGAAGDPAVMFAIFGFWTKVGNVVNSILNDDKEPGTPQDAADEVEAWLGSVNEGVWREAGTGAARGPKYDNAVLAVVLVALLGDKAKAGVAEYADRLAADKGYRAKVVARDDIKAAYWREMEARGVSRQPTSVDALA